MCIYHQIAVRMKCMEILFVVLVNHCIVFEAADALQKRTRIVQGDEAPRHLYSFQAMIFQTEGDTMEFKCGGSVVSPTFILTAAHCLIGDTPLEAYKVAVGSTLYLTDQESEFYYKPISIILHDGYNSYTAANDIALMELDSPIKYRRFLQTVLLDDTDQISPGSECFVSGFGMVNNVNSTLPVSLQEIETKFLKHKRCRRIAKKYDALARITPNILCTYNRKSGPCSGDSGGPLGCFDGSGNYTQYGVLSWGSSKCKKGFNVYTRVSKYKEWIIANLK